MQSTDRSYEDVAQMLLAYHNITTYWRIIEILDDNESKLRKRSWPLCKSKILVIVLIDFTLKELVPNMETDKPNGSGFDEIWLADYTQVEPFGGVDGNRCCSVSV